MAELQESRPELESFSGTGGFGFRDRHSGEVVIEPQYDAVMYFSQDRLGVRAQGVWILIDRHSGRTLSVPPRQFQDLRRVSAELTWALVGERWGMMDPDERFVLAPRFDAVLYFSDELDLAVAGEKCGLVAHSGLVVVEPECDSISVPTEGLAAFKLSGKCGYFDEHDGEMVIQPQFKTAGPFSQGVAHVQDFGTNKFGYIDRSAGYAIAPKFDAARPFDKDGHAWVQIANKWGRIDLDGQWVIQPRFDDFYPTEDGDWVKIDNKWGKIAHTDTWVIEPQYDAVMADQEGTWVRQGEQWKLIDCDGTEVELGERGQL